MRNKQKTLHLLLLFFFILLLHDLYSANFEDRVRGTVHNVNKVKKLLE